jgi:D-sedoheptulose 7-phosphate isomerase
MNIEDLIKQSISTKEKFLEDKTNLDKIQNIADACVEAFKNDGKVLLCGNGGSASDAQHIAAELSGRFQFDRPPLYAEALHVNTSYVTAVGNDYGYDEIYRRMVEAAGKSGDILIGISTSGNSANVIKAIEKANEIGMHTFGLSGQGGGLLEEKCNINIQVPSTNTARVQETHIMIGHIICEIIENQLFAK